MPIVYRLNTKMRLTMLCLSGFEQYSRWVTLNRENEGFIAVFSRCRQNVDFRIISVRKTI